MTSFTTHGTDMNPGKDPDLTSGTDPNLVISSDPSLIPGSYPIPSSNPTPGKI